MGKHRTDLSLAAVRLTAVGIYAYSVYYQQVNVTVPVKNAPFGKWKYLTYWDLVWKLCLIT